MSWIVMRRCVAVVASFAFAGTGVAADGPDVAPSTVAEAVRVLKESVLTPQERDSIVRMPARLAEAQLHMGLGMAIRDQMGLWRGNRALLDSCGVEHPDDCSAIIIRELVKALRADLDSFLVKALECQNWATERTKIDIEGFHKRLQGFILDSLRRQMNDQVGVLRQAAPEGCDPGVSILVLGSPDPNCWARAEFAGEHAPAVPLDLFLGWFAWRNAFTVRHEPPNLVFDYQQECAWPERPDWFLEE